MVVLLSVAVAADVHAGLQTGVAVRASESTQGTVAGTVVVRFSPLFAVEGSAGVRRGLERNTWRDRAAWSAPVYDLTPESTDLREVVSLRAVFSPLQGTLNENRPFALDLGVGPALVHTRDDLDALQCPQEPACQSTADQVHPALSWTVGPRVALSDRTSIQLRGEGLYWIEAYEGVNLRSTRDLAASVGLTTRL